MNSLGSYNNDDHPTEAATILAAGACLGEPRLTAGGRQFTVIPDNCKLLDLEHLLDKPTSKRGDLKLTELDSFIRYVKAFGEAGTQIFAHIRPESAVFAAVLDYHEGKGGDPAWGRHRVAYTPERTVEWLKWTAKNENWMKQIEFAAFIEDNLDQIVEPSGATMLEIAKTLEARSSTDFKSGVRLDNGDHSLKYVKETSAAAGGNGELTVPAEFALGIAPFNGGPAYRVKARLRYRIEDGKLFLRYELIQPHKVIEAACKEMVLAIQAATDIEPLAGQAPAAL